jgi:hypothetical protein
MIQIEWSLDGVVLSESDTLYTDLEGTYEVEYTVENEDGDLVQQNIGFQLFDLQIESIINVCYGTPILLSDFVYPDFIDSLNWVNSDNDTVLAFSDEVYTTEITNILGCEEVYSVHINVLNPGIIDSLLVFCYGTEWTLQNLDSPSFSNEVSIAWQGSNDLLSWVDLMSDSLFFSSSQDSTHYQFMRRISTYDTLNCLTNYSQIIQLGDTITSINVVPNLTVCPGDTLSLSPEGCQNYIYFDDFGPGSIISEDTSIIVIGSNFYDYNGINYTCSDTAEVEVDVVSLNPGIVSGNQLLCVDEQIMPFESVIDASSEAMLFLQWQQSLDGLNWSNITDATQQDYSADALATLNSSFRRLASVIISHDEIDTLQCQLSSNILFISVPNQVVDIQGPVDEICGNSYYTMVSANAVNSSFNWTINGGSIMSNSNQDNEIFIHVGTDDSCQVGVQITHLQSGCQQNVDYTIYLNDNLALDTVPVFVIDQNAHLLGIDPSTDADLISWGYSTLEGFEVEVNISNQPYCYFPNFNTQDFVYWVDLVSDDGCTTRSYLNFNLFESGIQEGNGKPIVAFPNPFNHQHHVYNPFESTIELSLFNTLGVCLEKRIINPSDSVSVGEFIQVGTYLILLVDANGNVYAYKIVKV